MLRSLSGGEHNIGALAAPHAMSFAAASKHVRVLEKAGLVRRRVQGRAHVCALQAKPLAEAERWLAFYQRFWGEQFDALDAVLKQDKQSKETP